MRTTRLRVSRSWIWNRLQTRWDWIPCTWAGISAEPAPAPRDGYKPRAVARLEEMRLTPEMDAKIVAMLDILFPEEDVKNDQT